MGEVWLKRYHVMPALTLDDKGDLTLGDIYTFYAHLAILLIARYRNSEGNDNQYAVSQRHEIFS